MGVGRVLARSLEVAWRYKVLWLLGFVMAITEGGANGVNYNFGGGELNSPLATPGQPLAPLRFQFAQVLAVLAFVACLLVLFSILVLYFRFVARGAQVTFVRTVENGGAPTLGSAWREGQSYYPRLLGLGFLFWVPLVVFSLLLLALALLPFLAIAIALFGEIARGQQPNFSPAPVISGVLGFLGLLCCAFLCLALVNLVLHPIYEFGVRGIVLEETGTIDGLSRGYRRLRANLGTVAVMYLVLIGVRIGWSLVIAVVAFPSGLLLLAIVGGAAIVLPAWAIVVIALSVGLPFALALALLGGLFQVFESNSWTECYLALLGASGASQSGGRTEQPITTD